MPADDAAASYTASGLSGNLSVNGSTSVGPVMEVLAEAYKALNPRCGHRRPADRLRHRHPPPPSTAPARSGMSSRALKDEEVAEGLTPVTIALDGIAVIVNQANTVEDLTAEQIRQIYTGEITDLEPAGLTQDRTTRRASSPPGCSRGKGSP